MADKNDPTNPDANPEESGENGRALFRRAFRVPLTDPNVLTVQVGDEHFGAIDIVEGGVAIFHASRNAFSVGEELDRITLRFRGEPLILKGRVVHLARDEANHFRYGVEFIELDSVAREHLQDIVKRARADFFSTPDEDE